jgi:hypothetical protein
MLVKIFDGDLIAEADDLEDRINQWLGSLVEEKAEVKRMTTTAYSAGASQHLVVTFLYESPLETAASPQG